jgi:hypothetical protein
MSALSCRSSATSTRRATAAPRPARAGRDGGAAPPAGASDATGRRTVNSLPRPGPSLRAAMRPPCSSTSRPREREPDAETVRRVRGRGPAGENMSNSRAAAGRDADAVVRHGDERLGALPLGAHAQVAAGLGVVRRVVEQVREDLRQPHGVGVEPDRLAGQRHDELVLPALDRGAARLDRRGDHVRELDASAAQLETPVRDARDIEQVLEQARHVADLPLDDLRAPAQLAVLQVARQEHLHAAPDRRERVAQLVRQHRQELVLAPVGLLQARARTPCAR